MVLALFQTYQSAFLFSLCDILLANEFVTHNNNVVRKKFLGEFGRTRCNTILLFLLQGNADIFFLLHCIHLQHDTRFSLYILVITTCAVRFTGKISRVHASAIDNVELIRSSCVKRKLLKEYHMDDNGSSERIIYLSIYIRYYVVSIPAPNFTT